MQTEVEAGNAPELGTVTPTGQEQAQQAVAGSESAPEQSAQPNDATQQDKPKNDWVQRRIDQLTRERHEERRQREALESRLRQYETQPPAEGQPASKPMTQDEVRAAAKHLVQQEKFDQSCNKVFDAGKTEFPDWDSSLKTFQMLGGAPQEFLEAVTEMDAGHKVIHHLGQNPEAAERLLGLPPLRMAFELARLETTLAKAPPVSKAPAPISPIGGKSAPVEPAEFGSTEEYAAWRRKNR